MARTGASPCQKTQAPLPHRHSPASATTLLPPCPPPRRRHDGPWWLTRAAVIAYLLVAVVVPTLVPRSLRVVAKFSSFSVCMLFLLASAISGLALVALAQGAIAQGVQWLPSYQAIGGSPLGALTSVLTVVSGERGSRDSRDQGLFWVEPECRLATSCALQLVHRWPGGPPAGVAGCNHASASCGPGITAPPCASSLAVSALAFTCQFNLL